LLLRGSRPKSVRASPEECSQSAPDAVQIGSLSANAWTPSKQAVVFSLFGWSRITRMFSVFCKMSLSIAAVLTVSQKRVPP